MKLIILILFIMAGNALATPVGVRYNYLTAESLPKSLWTYGLSTGQMSGTGTKSYDENGNLVSNERYYRSELSYKEISEQIKDEQERSLALAAFRVYGKNLDESVGYVENDVEVDVSSETYLFGRGLTDKADLFFIFPTVNIKTKFRSEFRASDSLNSLVSELRAEGQNSRAREIIEDSRNGLYKQLDENGYATEYPSEITSLANIYMNIRYKALDQGDFKILSDSFLIIPSGETFDDNQFLDLRINEEQYSLKQGFTLSQRFLQDFNVLISTSYHKRFPFRKTKRIPRSDTYRLTTDKDKNTSVQYGDTFALKTQLNYTIDPTFSAYMGQSFESRYADTYSGDKFESSRYELLEENTDQEIGQFYTGMTINTVDRFLKKKFIIPLDLNIQYAYSNFGKNVLDTQIITFNLIGFYK